VNVLNLTDMSKEIRFRAFDDGKMIYEKNIEHLTKEDNTILRLARFWSSVRNDSIIMQYTGLNDKNGTEIYDGDILTTETGKPMIVKWNERFASWCLYRDDWMFAHWFGESCQPEECVVIGNRYENPELLQDII